LNRPSIRGPYRPIRKGTVKGSTFAMLASALGTGMLNLPLRVEEVGVIPFIVLILISALLAYFGMNLMSKIIMRFKLSSYS
jgi:amino acid permease